MEHICINDKQIFVDLKFGPKWTYISTVRTFIENFMAISLDNKKKAGTIAMTVNELIENAIKYSDEDGIQIKLKIIYEENKIDVVVSNHACEAEELNLRKILTEINSLTPLEAYMKRMQESAATISSKSTIGLSRIRYESNANIRHTYQNGFVNVYAEIPTTCDGGNNE